MERFEDLMALTSNDYANRVDYMYASVIDTGDGGIYIKSLLKDGFQLRLDEVPSGRISKGMIVQFTPKLEKGLVIATNAKTLRGAPIELLTEVTGTVSSESDADFNHGLLDVDESSITLENVVAGQQSDAQTLVSRLRESLKFGLPILACELIRTGERRGTRPLLGDGLQVTICKYPDSEFYFARKLAVIRSPDPAQVTDSAVPCDTQEDNSTRSDRFFKPVTKHKPSLTLIAGSSRNGANLLDGFGLFRRSRYFRQQYDHQADVALRSEILKTWRKPRAYARRDEGYVWSCEGWDAWIGTGAAAAAEVDEEAASDPVSCTLTGEEAEGLATVGVTEQAVWDCAMFGPRTAADRDGSSYFARVEEQWSLVTRAEMPSIFSAEYEATLPPPPPLRPALQRLKEHATILDRRAENELSFDFSDPTINDADFQRQRARIKKINFPAIRAWMSRWEKAGVLEDGQYVQQMEHFVRFIKSHNKNITAFHSLLSATGMTDAEILTEGGTDIVIDSMVLVRKCHRFRCYTFFRKAAGARSSNISRSEVTALCRRGDLGTGDDSRANDAESGSGWDFSVTPVGELRDHSKTASATTKAAEIRAKIGSDRKFRTVLKAETPSESATASLSTPSYMPHVQHFRKFVAAHNEHVRRFQALLDEPDDLCWDTMRPVRNVDVLIKRCHRFKFHAVLGYETRFYRCTREIVGKIRTELRQRTREKFKFKSLKPDVHSRCKESAGANENFVRFLTQHQVALDRFLALPEREVPENCVISQTQLQLLHRQDVLMRQARRLASHVTQLVQDTFRTHRRRFVEGMLYRTEEEMPCVSQEQPLLVTAVLPNMPQRCVCKWRDGADSSSLELSTTLPNAEQFTTADALRVALAEETERSAWRLCTGESCTLVWDAGNASAALTVCGWGITSVHKISLNEYFTTPETAVVTGSSLAVRLGPAVDNNQQEEYLQNLMGAQRRVWWRWPWHSLAYEHFFGAFSLDVRQAAWQHVPVQQVYESVQALLQLAYVHGPQSVQEVLQWVPHNVQTVDAALRVWVAQLKSRDEQLPKALRLAGVSCAVLLALGGLARQLCLEGPLRLPGAWYPHWEQPYLVTDITAPEAKQSPGCVWSVGSTEDVADSNRALSALMAVHLNCAAFSKKWRVRPGAEIKLEFNAASQTCLLTYTLNGQSVEVTYPSEDIVVDAAVVLHRLSSSLEVNGAAEMEERYVWFRGPWRKMRFHDLAAAVPAFPRCTAADGTYLYFCETNEEVQWWPVRRALQLVLNTAMQLPADKLPRRHTGLDSKPWRLYQPNEDGSFRSDFARAAHLLYCGEADRFQEVLRAMPALAKEVCEESGDTLLAIAIAYLKEEDDRASVCRDLLGAGANSNHSNKDGVTLVDLALREQHEDVLQLLLQHAASPEAHRERGLPPLVQAVHSGSAALVKQLLFAGASVFKLLVQGRFMLGTALARWECCCDPDRPRRRFRDASAGEYEEMVRLLAAAHNIPMSVVDDHRGHPQPVRCFEDYGGYTRKIAALVKAQQREGATCSLSGDGTQLENTAALQYVLHRVDCRPITAYMENEEVAPLLLEAIEKGKVDSYEGMFMNPSAALARRVLEAAAHPNSVLHTLELHLNDALGTEYDDVVTAAASDRCKLKHLHLGGLSNEQFASLCGALGTNKTLVALYISEDDLTEQRVEVLLDALSLNTTLTSLELPQGAHNAKYRKRIRQSVRSGLCIKVFGMADSHDEDSDKEDTNSTKSSDTSGGGLHQQEDTDPVEVMDDGDDDDAAAHDPVWVPSE